MSCPWAQATHSLVRADLGETAPRDVRVPRDMTVGELAAREGIAAPWRLGVAIGFGVGWAERVKQRFLDARKTLGAQGVADGARLEAWGGERGLLGGCRGGTSGGAGSSGDAALAGALIPPDAAAAALVGEVPAVNDSRALPSHRHTADAGPREPVPARGKKRPAPESDDDDDDDANDEDYEEVEEEDDDFIDDGE